MSGMTRRNFLEIGAAGIAGIAASDLLAKPLATLGELKLGKINYFDGFGITQELIGKALGVALQTGGDLADLFFQHNINNFLMLSDGTVNRAYKSVTLGVGIRVVVGDQVGFGFTEDLSSNAIIETARTAASIANGSPGAFGQTFHYKSDVPDRYHIQTPWEEIRPAKKLEILTRLNEQVFKTDSRIKKANVFFGDSSSAMLLANSNGLIVEDIQPMTRLYVSCVAEQGDKREQNGYNIAARSGMEFYTKERLDRLVKNAVERTTVLFEAEPAPAGEMPVVMAAGSSGILLHEAIGHGMEADFNRKNTSIYSDKIGKPIAQPFVNIVDDGSQSHARGAINIDDEGNDAGKTLLVENGILKSYLHDSISAKHYGLNPTGNGRRESYKYAPMPRMRSTYMLEGPHTEEEIIQSVKKGLYCSNFSNGEVNIGAGDFTFYVKNGYLIENGKLTKPVKDVNIIGNGPKVLEKVDMVGDNLVIDEGGWTCGKNGQSVPVSQGLPTVRVSSITVGGKNA